MTASLRKVGETLTTIDAIRPMLAEAATWRFLGLLFERPRAGWGEQLEAVAESTGDAALLDLARDAARDADEGTYLAILGPGGGVPSREAGYETMRDTGRVLAELRGLYEAFGFAPRTEEPPDHLSVELGFPGYLMLKRAYARLHDQPGEAEIVESATSMFFEGHLSPFAVALAQRLAPLGAGYLSRAAAAVAARVPAPARASGAAPEIFDACAGCSFE